MTINGSAHAAVETLREGLAKAYEANPEFFAFSRSIEAYKQSFKSKNDVLVLEPNSEFFKYLRSGGKAGK